MGKELISASGKGHKAITIYWIVFLISAIACVSVFTFIANDIGYTHTKEYTGTFPPRIESVTNKNQLYYIFTAVGVILGILLVGAGYQCHTRVSRTVVDVYEDGIKGLGIGVDFPWSSSQTQHQLSDFHLTYDQVPSVDVVEETTLVIHTVNAKYKIYAMNAKEVRDVIITQKNAVNKN